jgi:predicted nucleic acid-binding Zn ribbon protein
VTRRPRVLKDVIPGLRSRLAPASLLADVQTRWADVAGEEVAREAQPVAARAGVVTVSCSSSVWASELSMMSSRLVEGLNEHRPDGAPPVVALRFNVAGRPA